MELVFVHFGSKYPKHLILNLKRTCDLFPELMIVLITDVPAKLRIDKINFRKSDFRMDIDYEMLDKNLNHPKNFRNNFWFTSLARIYALCDYVATNNESILHIESDVLISGDLPIDRFAQCDRPIAFTVVGKSSGVASVLWIKDARAANRLRTYASNSAHQDPMTTDMKILGHFQEDHPDLVRVLASFPTENPDSYNPLSLQLLEDFAYTQNLFEGFFDAADVGRYLLGDDPRNHRGIKFIRHQLDTSYFSPRRVKYVYSESRRFLNIASKSSNPFYSLHIHSKNAKVFRDRRMPDVICRAVRSQSEPERKILVIPILFQSVRNSLIRRFRVLIAGQN